jgi:type IV pilus assembly protein PilA
MSTLVIVLIVGGLATCCIVGVLAAIAIPNFIKFQAKAKQSEARANLKAAFVGQKAVFGEKDTYSTDLEEVGFSPGPGNRYLYVLAAEGDLAKPGEPGAGKVGVFADSAKFPDIDNEALERAIPPELRAELGVQGKCPEECSITIVAVGNVDRDSTVDVWSVSTKDRKIDGRQVLGGTPHNHVDDTAVE